MILLLCSLAAAAERRFAVVIGSDGGDAGEVQLHFAESDAARTARVLTELGGVAPEDLVVLAHPDAARVRATFARLRDRVATELGDDRAMLVVYYSGHADATDLHLGGTRLPLTELEGLVSGIRADARVLVLDACRAGELTRARGAVPADPFTIVVQDRLTIDGLAIITAAAAGEDAQESDRLQGGVFTHHFLAGLEGAADVSEDRRVTLTEAYRYAYDRTIATTSVAPTLQHPSLALDLRGRDDIVLTRLDDPGRGAWLRLATAGEYLVFDPHGQALILEATVPAGGTLALPAGRYLVRRRTPSRLYEAAVTMNAGQIVALGEADLDAVPVGQATRRGGRGHTAFAVGAGGGVRGPIATDDPATPEASLGVRVETRTVSLYVRARGTSAAWDTDILNLTQREIGGDLSALKLVDLGAFSLGAGVDVGGAAVLQTFETYGQAPERTSAIGWVGSVGRAEWSPHPRIVIGAEIGVDATLTRTEAETFVAAPSLGARVVPRGGLDAAFWVF
jgi:hypothetical protein